MGTRAIITIDEKPLIATHWDGYPDGLGNGLINAKTIADIVAVADRKTIDFANLNLPEIRSHLEIRKAHIENKKDWGIISAEDWDIGSIENYGDFAEYQYDLHQYSWRVRSLSGKWPESKDNAGKWFSLSDALNGVDIDEEAP